MRIALTWLTYALSMAMVLVAMWFISMAVLDLEKQQSQARQATQMEEAVRSALWRMDAAIAPIVARENARAPEDYQLNITSPDSDSSNDALKRVAASELASVRAEHVLLYFQINSDGRIQSPQVAAERMAQSAEASEYQQRLSRLRTEFGWDKFESIVSGAPALPSYVLRHPRFANPQQDEPEEVQPQTNAPASQEAQQARMPQQAAQQSLPLEESLKNTFQAHKRVEANLLQQQLALPTRQAAREHQQVMRPYWIGQELFLLRTIRVNGETVIQGCWLNWPVLEHAMLDSIVDLLPNASLEPVTQRSDRDPYRMLASVPVSLRPGHVPVTEIAVSPVRISVYLAWTCVLLAAVAVAVLINGTLSLSQRRASFVSAVSHEMRTPLTTFRMYTEMLSQGMVKDPAKQAQYLQVLHREARRLGHLVDNVLSYARLDSGRRPECVKMPLGELLDSIMPRLRERCEQASCELALNIDEAQRDVHVLAEMAGVEQVLFNLVDNACKYAAGTIELSIRTEPNICAIQVRDHGKGMDSQAIKTIFRPFSKSAQTAAQQGIGVGLGLALSRRYARQLGGELKLISSGDGGTCFALTLKRA